MKPLALFLLTTAHILATPVDDFIASAAAKHGAFGEKSARFLVAHMPEPDKRTLTAEFLTDNLDLAFTARATFPWAKNVPEDLFLNDVLPYAVFDEPRDPWRADFFEKAGELVKDAKTASEAAQILNRDFFKRINTHYHTERKRTNQSPKESIEQGRATCTGLSIILVAACRSVGIPARAAGTPRWWNNSGNHTWVEIWDQGWHFTGADEFNDKGLNHAWFIGHAARGDAKDGLRSIYATSWKKDGVFFPMVWAPGCESVGGVNVTERYRIDDEPVNPSIGIRFFDGDERAVRKGALTTEAGFSMARFETKAGTTDMNDTPRLDVTPGKTYRLRFEIDDTAHETASFTIDGNHHDIHDVRPSHLSPVPDISDDAAAFSKDDARRAIAFTYETMGWRPAQARLRALIHRPGSRWLPRPASDCRAGRTARRRNVAPAGPGWIARCSSRAGSCRCRRRRRGAVAEIPGRSGPRSAPDRPAWAPAAGCPGD